MEALFKDEKKAPGKILGEKNFSSLMLNIILNELAQLDDLTQLIVAFLDKYIYSLLI